MPRQSLAKNWLANELKIAYRDWQPLLGDASTRSFYRCQDATRPYVIMDSAHAHDNLPAFLAIAEHWLELKLPVPEIYAVHPEGLVLMSDLGQDDLLNKLNEDSVDNYYQQAFKHILAFQPHQEIAGHPLRSFVKEIFPSEFALFREWFLEKYLGLQLTTAEEACLTSLYTDLEKTIAAQPEQVVHRDFHARNLMVNRHGQLGIVDFQDAVLGPCSYDLMSLIQDAYVQWPIAQVEGWIAQFYQQLPAALQQQGLVAFQTGAWKVSLQRHLKILGIFARLGLRDKKTRYWADLPRVWQYTLSEVARFPEYKAFGEFLAHRVAPLFLAKQGGPIYAT